jgi:REP element-mobilizing transposase RayT
LELLPWGEIADKYIRQLNDFYDNIRVDSYVIMPNHIHILLFVQMPTSGPSGRPVPTAQNSTVSRFISTFKRFCNKEFGRNIWQARFYDHIIRSQDDYDEHLRYIHDNPFRWQEDELFSMD